MRYYNFVRETKKAQKWVNKWCIWYYSINIAIANRHLQKVTSNMINILLYSREGAPYLHFETGGGSDFFFISGHP